MSALRENSYERKPVSGAVSHEPEITLSVARMPTESRLVRLVSTGYC